MAARLQLGEVEIDVVLKDIKNIHLSVYPPAGRVRISAPSYMSLDTIRVFAISKLDWIKKQQCKLQEQARETPREYLNRESHHVWGKRYLLKVVEATTGAPAVELNHNQMILSVRPGTDVAKCHAVVEAWFREQLKQATSPIIEKWEPVLGVEVDRVFVQRMKTKWGSCNPMTCSLRLNSDLAKKPRECLEYIVVHEMVHLLEPNHGPHFITLMDQFMPHWRHYRDQLNRLPVGHEEWAY